MFSPSGVRLGKLRFDQVDKCRIVQFHTCQKSLGQLFTGFLKYYAEFDYEKCCLMLTEKVDRNDDRLQSIRNLSERLQPIIIVEPFQSYRNAAFAVHRGSMKKIVKTFKSCNDLAKSKAVTFKELCQPARRNSTKEENNDEEIESFLDAFALD